jgi:flagellar biosynthesis/type III secretory pathway protein FliH
VTPPARILRNAAPVAGRLVPAAVHEADRRVRELVSAAEDEARRLRVEAAGERDRILAQAAEEGRREGLARAAATLAAAAAERDRRLAALGHEVAAIAVDVARAVLGRELSASAGAVAELAGRALAVARDRREVTLRVNPADAAGVRGAEGRLAAILRRAPLAVREDPAVPQGGAVVETEAGRVDACVETQLAALARALEEAVP